MLYASPRLRRTPRARIQVVPPGKPRSGRAISVATAARSIAAPAARRHAAAVSSSTANVSPRPTPPIHRTCPSGYVSIGSACCLASQRTSTGTCCPSRTSTKRSQQDTMPAAHSHSDQMAAAAMLRGRSNSGREPIVLRGSERDDGWHVLFRPGRGGRPRALSGKNAGRSSLRDRLYQDARRDVLQQSIPQPRRKILQYRRAALCARRVP